MKLTQFERYEIYDLNFVEIKDEVIIEHYGSSEHFEECLRTEEEEEVYDWINSREDGEIKYFEKSQPYQSTKRESIYALRKEHIRPN